MAFKRNGERQQVNGAAGGDVFLAGNLRAWANSLLDCFSGILGALGVSRSDDHGLARLRPAQGQAEAFGAGASENRDGAGFAHGTPVMRIPARATARRSAPRVAS